MQNQLNNIFDEEMQIKRIGKEISHFTSNDEMKTLLDHRLTYIRKQQLIFHISLKAAYFNKYRLDPSLCPLNLKLIYTNSYPYTQPRLYFVSQNINQLYTVIGRDYFRQICPDWSAKLQLLDLLPLISTFLDRIPRQQHQHRVGLYNRGQFIQMQPLYSLKSSQFYPIQVMMNQRPESAFLIVNRFDFILLEQSTVQNYLRLIDAYSLSSVKYILRSKRTEKKILLLMRVMEDQEIGLEFLSDDHDNIVESVIQKKRTAPVYEDTVEEYVEQEEQEEDGEEQKSDEPPAPKISLEQINEQIIIYESLLDRDFSESVVNNLIQLYNRAIEMCSATASESYKFYLDKLRDLLSNEAVQVLMSSTVEAKGSKESIFVEFENQIPSEEKKVKKSQQEDIDFFEKQPKKSKNDDVVQLL